MKRLAYCLIALVILIDFLLIVLYVMTCFQIRLGEHRKKAI